MLNTDEVAEIMDHGFDMGERRIYLMNDMNDENISKIIKSIHILNRIAPTPIILWLNSQGGETSNMFALYDVIVSSPAPITTIGLGEVCSAALLILACGAKRLATENCWSLHHQISYTATGTEQVVETEAAAARRQATNRYRLLAAHSRKKASWWEQKTKETGDIWLNSEQLLEIGIIDDIIRNPKRAHIKIVRTKKVIESLNET